MRRRSLCSLVDPRLKLLQHFCTNRLWQYRCQSVRRVNASASWWNASPVAPVAIGRYGRERALLVSAEEYRRLKTSTRRAKPPPTLEGTLTLKCSPEELIAESRRQGDFLACPGKPGRTEAAPIQPQMTTRGHRHSHTGVFRQRQGSVGEPKMR